MERQGARSRVGRDDQAKWPDCRKLMKERDGNRLRWKGEWKVLSGNEVSAEYHHGRAWDRSVNEMHFIFLLYPEWIKSSLWAAVYIDRVFLLNKYKVIVLVFFIFGMQILISPSNSNIFHLNWMMLHIFMFGIQASFLSISFYPLTSKWTV